jgi:hypothetical protein
MIGLFLVVEAEIFALDTIDVPIDVPLPIIMAT